MIRVTSVNSKGNLVSRTDINVQCAAAFGGFTCDHAFGLVHFPGEVSLALPLVPPSGQPFDGYTMPLVSVSNVLIANSWLALFNDPLQNSWRTAGVLPLSGDHAWTGFNQTGLTVTPNCVSWTSSASSDSGYAAASGDTAVGWMTNHGPLPCNDNEHVICICIPITASPTLRPTNPTNSPITPAPTTPGQTYSPSHSPSKHPTALPTPFGFTDSPTRLPTRNPSASPTHAPTHSFISFSPADLAGLIIGMFFAGVVVMLVFARFGRVRYVRL